MPIRTFNPTSPGQRFQSVQTFDEITTSEPYKPLVEPLQRSGGRNNQGELTSWWRGGGSCGGRGRHCGRWHGGRECRGSADD